MELSKREQTPGRQISIPWKSYVHIFCPAHLRYSGSPSSPPWWVSGEELGTEDSTRACPFVLWGGFPWPLVSPLEIPLMGEWFPEDWWVLMPLWRWRGEPCLTGDVVVMDEGLLADVAAGLILPLIRGLSSLAMWCRPLLTLLLSLLVSPLTSFCGSRRDAGWDSSLSSIFLLVDLVAFQRGRLAVGSNTSSCGRLSPWEPGDGDSGSAGVGECPLLLPGGVKLWGLFLQQTPKQ